MRYCCGMNMSVREAAKVLRISEQRVRQLINTGQLPAQRVGKIWIIDRQSLQAARQARRQPGRPLALAMADGLVDLIAQHLGQRPGHAWDQLTPRNKQRLHSHYMQLTDVPNPASLLRAWIPRNNKRPFSYKGRLDELLQDPRLLPGGWLNPALGLTGEQPVFHAATQNIDAIVLDHLLIESATRNLVLYIEDEPRADIAACLIDLASEGGPRADATVKRWIQE